MSGSEWRVFPDPSVEDLGWLWRGDDDLAISGPPDHLRAIADAMNARRWRPIETAPRDGTKVLLFERGDGPFVGYWYEDGYWTTADRDVIGDPEPTHWQPLPPPPGDAG